jgi:hypothetical protein
MASLAGIFSTDDPVADRRQIEAESAECGESEGQRLFYCPVCHQEDEVCECPSADDD